MSVYVDAPIWSYGRMVMCHLIADSRAELDEMADRIGVARRWIQKADTPDEHYDIAKVKRALAVKAGAIEVDRRSFVNLLRRKRAASHPTPAGEPPHQERTDNG